MDDRICIGWDGCLYIEDNGWLAKLDRAGKVVYKIQLPSGDARGRIGADAAGHAATRRGSER